MDEDKFERLVLCFESISRSLEGINETAKRAGNRFWPEQPKQKEAVWSRVETDEDRAKKNLGVSDESISIDKWLEPDWIEDDGGIIGERSRQWLRDHPEEGEKATVVDAGTEVRLFGEKDSASPEKVESETGSVGDGSANHAAPKNKYKRRTSRRS
jgi:hypothetical protein